MKKRWIIAIVCIILFFFLYVFSYNIDFCIDAFGRNYIYNFMENDIGIEGAKLFSFLGSFWCLLLISLIFIIFIKNKKYCSFIILNLGLVTLINQGLKILIRRLRPDYALVDEFGFSFPSGHAMVSLAFYGLIIYLLNKNIQNNKLKISIIIVLNILIIGIGLSRVYLGVHYFSDVLAGFFLAIFYLIVLLSFYERNEKMKSKNLIHSFGYALEGIVSAFKSERNMKIHILVMILVIIMGLYFKISTYEWISLVIIIALVIGSELFNTAIEEAVNIASPDINNHAKLAKDIAAGAVMIFAFASIIIGLIIFIPKIIELI